MVPTYQCVLDRVCLLHYVNLLILLSSIDLCIPRNLGLRGIILREPKALFSYIPGNQEQLTLLHLHVPSLEISEIQCKNFAMAGEDIRPKPSPSLNLPKSENTCDVHIINTTTNLVVPAWAFVSPVQKGHETMNMPVR